MEDVVDAVIVAEFLEMNGMEDMDSTPKCMPVLSLMTPDQQTQWIENQAKEIMSRLQVRFFNVFICFE